MNRQEFQSQIADLLQIVDLYGDEFLDRTEQYEVSDKLNEVLDMVR